MANATGQVVQVQGGVVDCAFPPGELPNVYDAIEVPRDGAEPLILEVQRHLGDSLVRTVAMDTTDGLRRGARARGTGSPIRVPVGEATLGRVFNVLGRPIDGRGPVEAARTYPIHRRRRPSRTNPGGWRSSRPA